MRYFVFTFLFLLTACGIEKHIPVTADIVQTVMPKIVTQRYAKDIDDLPLYQGLNLVTDSHSMYDTVDGRIVTSQYYRRGATVAQVKNYYSALLPQLGWKKLDSSTYQREKETLLLVISHHKKGVLVSVSLKPLNSAQ